MSAVVVAVCRVVLVTVVEAQPLRSKVLPDDLEIIQRLRVYSSAGVSASPWASCSLFASTFSAGSAGALLLLALGFFIVTTIDGATRAPPLRLSSSVDKVEGLMRPRVARAAISPSFVVGA